MTNNSRIYDALSSQYREANNIQITYQDIFNDFATRMPSFVDYVDRWCAAIEEYKSIHIWTKNKKHYLYRYGSGYLTEVSR